MNRDISKRPPPELSSLADTLADAAEAITDRETARGLPADAAEAIARRVILDRLTAQADQADRIAGVDMAALFETFAAGCRSAQTARAYRRAWVRLVSWCNDTGKDPRALTAADIDTFVLYERAAKNPATGAAYSSATVRACVHGLAAFYRFACRHHPELKNPWPGCPVLPALVRPVAVIPTAAELRKIERAAADRGDAALALAVALMAATGIRIGGLEGLTVQKSGAWSTYSKGKTVHGADRLPAGILSRLPGPRPFAGEKSENIRKRFYTLTGDMQAAGLIAGRYSVHDIRHAYAEAHYRKNRDIYALSKALGHAGIAVTENYLRNSLGIDPAKR